MIYQCQNKHYYFSVEKDRQSSVWHDEQEAAFSVVVAAVVVVAVVGCP